MLFLISPGGGLTFDGGSVDLWLGFDVLQFAEWLEGGNVGISWELDSLSIRSHMVGNNLLWNSSFVAYILEIY